MKYRSPSTVQLPPGSWPTVLDFLCEHFAHIDRATWLSRIERELVLNDAGSPIDAQTPYKVGRTIRYFREVSNEKPIPFVEKILYSDANIVVVDKPHFLPVTPSGSYVEQTLLARVIERLDNPNLVPLHRLDRGTAGLVMFSAKPETRDHYYALFRDRSMTKHYEAIAPALPQPSFPLVHRSRLERGEPFFRMKEVAGVPNSETHIDVLERGAVNWRYALAPVTGKQHQLRVHMAALGAGILNDPFYPTLTSGANDEDDFERPLQLLAAALAFVDPLSGREMRFRSELRLQALADPLSTPR